MFLELLPGRISECPGLDVQHATDDLMSKSSGKVDLVFNNMGKTTVEAKINMEVGKSFGYIPEKSLRIKTFQAKVLFKKKIVMLKP